jgi:ComF family protein
LSLALAQRIKAQELPLPALLVPVPLHAARQYARGFNQSLEICRVLGRALAIPYDCRIVRRRRMTAPMFSLTPGARRRNIRGAFQVTRPPPADHVAIVDDIMTSGATARELSRALRRAGAARVEVWALARAEPP